MKKIVVYAIILFATTIGVSEIVIGQIVPDLPQRSTTVLATQMLHFGDFTLTSNTAGGGTVTVDYMGNRTAGGNVVLLNLGNSAQQASFELKLCPGRRITINYNTNVTLNGSNGGSMSLILGSTNFGGSGSTFTSNKGCNDIHQITIGGELSVSSMSSNPAGEYTGSFNVIFNQE